MMPAVFSEKIELLTKRDSLLVRLEFSHWIWRLSIGESLLKAFIATIPRSPDDQVMKLFVFAKQIEK